jgi:tRNA threonylcarbamoyladenosine biosynthesis protein TsaB
VRAVLAIATSGPRSEVGLLREGVPLRVVDLGQGAERGREVAPAIARLLDEAGLEPEALGAVAVDVGPGSFTGTRVGVATAKGLHVGVGVPVVAVSSLDALARAAEDAPGTILALRDARAGEAYFALYRPGGPGRAPVALGPPARGRADDVRAALAAAGVAKALAVGEDAERLAVTMGLGPALLGVRTPFAGAAEVLAVALPRIARGEADAADALAPLYLQPSTPERRLAEAGGTPPPPPR